MFFKDLVWHRASYDSRLMFSLRYRSTAVHLFHSRYITLTVIVAKLYNAFLVAFKTKKHLQRLMLLLNIKYATSFTFLKAGWAFLFFLKK